MNFKEKDRFGERVRYPRHLTEHRAWKLVHTYCYLHDKSMLGIIKQIRQAFPLGMRTAVAQLARSARRLSRFDGRGLA